MKTCNDCIGCEGDETDGKIACKSFIQRKGESSMKLIYKSPMTEQEQREAFLELLDKAYDGRTSKEFEGTERLSKKAMEICRNDVKVVEGVEIYFNTGMVYEGNLKLTVEQIKEAYRLIEG